MGKIGKLRRLAAALSLFCLLAYLLAAPAMAAGFQDVGPDAWYAGAVDYVSARGVMNGTSEDQFEPSSAHFEASAHYLACVWRQVAERFRDYDEHLILESMNEPRLMNSSYEWSFNPDAPECFTIFDAISSRMIWREDWAPGGCSLRHSSRYALAWQIPSCVGGNERTNRSDCRTY